MERLGIDAYFLVIAQTAALRSTCPRRQVGAVAVTDGKIVSTGYNGSVTNSVHCSDEGVGCLMVNGNCIRTIHAETNAIAQAGGKPMDVMYVTTQPCLPCVKSMLAERVKLCIYRLPYPSRDRDAFLQGCGLAGDPERRIEGWMRQVNCPDLSELGGVPRVRSPYGECDTCGHVYTNGDLAPDDLGCWTTLVCPVCDPEAVINCPICEGHPRQMARSQFLGQPPVLVACPACEGSGKVKKRWTTARNNGPTKHELTDWIVEARLTDGDRV